jgi:flavin reductase (DIM6/NTAB) family NADH-FMN oxidoreductase RutF
MSETVEFRAAMRQVASGVAIVTTIEGGERYGITATSAASVSEDPPLISIGVNKQSWICDALMRSKRFCINMLGVSQLDVAKAFSVNPRETRFETGEWTSLTTGAPVLVEAPAVFDCELFQAIEVKTHYLVIGHILTTRTADNIAPLIYRDRKYVTVGEMQA